MSDDDVIKLISSVLVTAHLAVGFRAWRAPETFVAIPRLTLLMVSLLLGLSIEDWVDTSRHGHPLEPLTLFGLVYGGAVFALSLAYLTRRLGPRGLHWTVFVLHTLVALALTYFMFTFRMERLW